MPKKKIRQKHQADPGDSTDSSDEENRAQQCETCPHITKAVSVAGLKRAFKSEFSFGECQTCQKKSKDVTQQNDGDDELLIDDSTWLCLLCGHQGCGRNSSQHSLKHFRTPRSDCHAIVVNSTSWAVWCYECDDEVSIEGSRRLKECIDFVRKQVGLAVKKKAAVVPSEQAKIGDSQLSTVEEKEPQKGDENTKRSVQKTRNGLVNNLPKIKGLSNLGNTCFFNAVMQNLTQSERFVAVLRSHSGENATWRLPKECFDASEPVEEIVLPECGALTQAVLDFFTNMNMQGKNGIANPNYLFGQVCKKAPQFRGFQQQDSHELLRHLLDGVRTEEIKRQKRGILRAFGLSEKVNTNEVNEELKKKIKAYGRQASHTVVDGVFGGQLVSTVLCEECHQPSQVIEPFMDLSLQVGEEKPTRPGMQRRSLSSDEPPVETVGRRQAKTENSKPSKYQEKKMKKQAKKESKRQVKAAKASPSKLHISIEEKQEPEQTVSKDLSDEMSENDLTDADVEDNDETETSSRHSPCSSCFPTGNNSSQETEKNSRPTKNAGEPHFENGSEKDAENGKQETQTVSDLEKNHKNGELKTYTADCTELKEQDSDPLKSISSSRNECNFNTQEQPISTADLEEDVDILLETSCHNEQSSTKIECTSETTERISASDIKEQFVSSTHPLENHTEAEFPKDSPQNINSNRNETHDRKMNEVCARMIRLSIRRKSESKDSLLETPDEKISNGAGEEGVSPMDENSVGSTDSGIGEGEKHEERDKQESSDSKILDQECTTKLLTTLAPRYHPTSHECSVMSCLHQFTMLELLTGNNKFGCENCTKNKIGKSRVSNLKEEPVYTNASKQLLILCPPSILTLHLKRFQQVGRSLKKVNKFVDFPFLLDLAPFCSSLALGLTHVNKGQPQILYSLYGVVEHSGRLTGGHYTAFVKVRKSQDKASSSYLNEFPIGLQEIEQLKTQMLYKYTMQASSSLETDFPVESDEGVWYHVSDSHVSAVSESTVLRCQAYLLFYERVM